MTLGEYDVAVIGGGLVGVATAWGLAREGCKVVVLDEGDRAVRASRGNFALVWVQGKGMGLAPYAGWTARSALAWSGFADLLKQETGLDVSFVRPGGFTLALSQRELEARVEALKRLHGQAGIFDTKTEILDHDRIARMLPGLGREVVGGSYCPLDGQVNSLRLLRTLHTAIQARGATYLPGHRVDAITHEAGEFRLATAHGEVRAAKVALAAGNANMRLAPMVGLDCPMRPERGQIVVTERLQPFLHHPIVTLRQTDEGTVMIGDSKEDSTDPTGLTLGVSATEAERAVRMFPVLAGANVVRTWSAIRVMTRDGFPIYDQSESHPGAFTVCCHSGVTLCANHALTIAPMIARGALDDSLVGSFSARRFEGRSHVQAAG
jgi:glycine/D-amino acid oxidase-like deaminating enzyme